MWSMRHMEEGIENSGSNVGFLFWAKLGYISVGVIFVHHHEHAKLDAVTRNKPKQSIGG